MFCTKCGAEVKEGAKFCSKCGNVMNVTSTASNNQTFKSATTFNSNVSNNSNVLTGEVKYIGFIGIIVLQLILWIAGGFSLNLATVNEYSSSTINDLSVYGLSSLLGKDSLSFNTLCSSIPKLLKTAKSQISFWLGSEAAANIPTLGYLSAINVFVYLLLIAGIGLCVYALVTKKEIFETSIIPAATSVLIIIVVLVASSKLKNLALTYLYSSDIISLNFGGILLIIVSILCIMFAGLQLFLKVNNK